MDTNIEPKKQNALVVEDDESIIELLRIHIEDLGYKVTTSGDGLLGLDLSRKNKFDLIILDIMLPGMDGLEVCKQIRQRDKKTPIIMLTSRSEEIDKVLGLELGADDYITKPFSIREFIARVKALVRRLEITETPDVEETVKGLLSFDNLILDMEKRKVTLDGKILDLTVKEYDLLELFARNPGASFTRQKLLELIWGYSFSGYDHTVNTHINRLRNKIEKDPSQPRFIQTVWGVGYRFIDHEEL